MERALLNYIEELKSDIASLVYSDGDGASFEDKFTEYCIQVLESIGKTEGARVLSYVHPNSQGTIDWKINGYCLKDQYKEENNQVYFESLDLFITYYRNDNYNYNITKDEFNKPLNQLKRFINAALKRHIDYVDKSNTELIELIKLIGKSGKEFDRINVYFLINGFCQQQKERIEISDIDVYVQNWDIARLFKINEANSIHEPIEIEFEKLTKDGQGLQCLKVPSIDELYDCYLAIIPGEVLAKLYGEYSNELLESNVRAFLGQTGKFNKGIKDTIRGKPHMFLPYNNGITATADNVEVKGPENQLFISKVEDFQIVNGGQTTASLYHTKRKFKDVDLHKIFVQMKLTVIKDKEQKNIEIPNISRYANSQNKVSELDLSSNNLFFIQIENLSRKKYVVNPDNKNQSLLWFFERTNGQYRETVNRLEKKQQLAFKEQNPSQLKFLKSDIAKFINLWELEPHFVCQGSQKSFVHFLDKVSDLSLKNRAPGENFYKRLVANAIIYKEVDRLFGRKNIDAIGDTNLKSFTVAYTSSWFHYLTNNRLDLWKIYEEQKIDPVISVEIKKLLIFVYNHLIVEANNSLISEYAKRESSWKRLKETPYDENLETILENCLVSNAERKDRENEKEVNANHVEDVVFQVSEIQKLGLKFWDGFLKHIEKVKLKEFDFYVAFDLLKKLKEQKNLTQREISFGRKVLEYVKSDPLILDQIRSLSKLEEEEKVEIKFIYDKLMLITKEEWKRITALASQTQIFSNLEFSNVKSVQTSLIRKEKVKEQALIKAYDSLKKLKKFGIDI